MYVLLGSAYITVDESSSEGSDSAVSSSDSEEDVASRSNSNNSSSDSEDSDNSNPFSTKSESKRPTMFSNSVYMSYSSEYLREKMHFKTVCISFR